VRQPDVAADRRAAADGDAAEDGRPGVDHHVVLDDRMAWRALLQGSVGIDAEAFGAEGDRLVEAHPIADDRGFADDHAGTVIDEEAVADACARVDVDAGGGVGEFGDDARQQRHAQPYSVCARR
jgi:hypothetical protein